MATEHHDDHGHGLSHVASTKVLLGTGGALMVLTAITVLATKVDFGPSINLALAMFIAVIKATLVVLFFMHVKYGTRLIPVVIGSGAFFLVILFAITMSDYMSRGWLGAGTPWRP